LDLATLQKQASRGNASRGNAYRDSAHRDSASRDSAYRDAASGDSASRGTASPATRVPAATEALPSSRLQSRSALPGRRELEGLGRPRTAAERVLAAELQARGDDADALSMMVSSIARMVQAGKTRDSRWKAS